MKSILVKKNMELVKINNYTIILIHVQMHKPRM